MARTQQERKAATRARLLDAAADLFAHKGVHAVSVDAVADAADRTSGAVYAHFGSKEGLLAALVDHWSDQAAAEIAGSLDTAGTTDERLDAIWQGFTNPPGDRGASWLLLEHELWLHAARTPELADVLARRFAAGRTGLGEAIARWAGDGSEAGAQPDSGPGPDVARLPAPAAATLMLGLLLGLEMQRRVDPDAVDDDLARTGLALLAGLAEPDREPADVPPT